MQRVLFMKLNYKRTVCVGFAFFLICAFWQAYDNSIPMLLTHKFHMSQTISGMIMALDNILALFMLPVFGMISDRTRSRWGRRTPFIMYGTLAAAVFFVLLPFIDSLPLFIAVLLAALIAMATFRTPAVALMPDITMKPLRSKGNAVINLMGSAAGILVLALGIVFHTARSVENPSVFKPYFISVAVIMLLALGIFLATVREPRFVREMHEDSVKYGIADRREEEDEQQKENHAGNRLSPAERRSMIFMLISIVLWFMAYNAAISKYSVYAVSILKKDYNLNLIVAQAAAIVSYIPVGILASKIGRKKSIIGGVILLAVSFGTIATFREGSSSILMNVMFMTTGVAWATINVNSFPMVVEMCSEADVGKYTGFYYTASMSAQIVTPIFSGFLMDKINMTILFPYCVIFVVVSLVTMHFVRHGDSRPAAKTGLEALEDI